MLSTYGRRRVNLLGFLNLVTYETESVMNDSYLNSDSVCERLEKLRKKYLDEFIYVILDNVAYQRCKKVKRKAEELNINLVFLPPSVYENLTEETIAVLKKKVLSHKFFVRFKSILPW